MNLALEKCEEHVDGVKKRTYGDAFVRGNNGERLSLSIGGLANMEGQSCTSRRTE